jgi:protein-disulfide isomerase
MIRILTLSVALLLGAVVTHTAQAAQFGPAEHKIIATDGTEMTNFALSPALTQGIQELGALVPVGNPNGDVTLYQFYDLNCPFCREASRDVDQLIKSDSKLKLVFVPYPVLSVDSVRGGMVEVAASRLLTPDKFLELHRRVYAGRGVIDGARVLEAATALGLDRDKLVAAAQNEATLNVLKSHADFGSAARLNATPAYVINGVAIVGHPGLKPLHQVVAAVRACGKVVC